jgi:membrane protease YdiL (CAAX protease family)
MTDLPQNAPSPPTADRQPRALPTALESFILLGVCLGLLLAATCFPLLGNLRVSSGPDAKFTGLLLLETLSLGLPLAVFFLMKRCDLKESLGLFRCGAGTLAGSALLGAGTMVLAAQLEAWQDRLVPSPEGYLEGLSGLVALEPGGSIAWVLLCLAVVPSLFEEALFRGVLLRTVLRRTSSRLTAVLGIGILFGLFHLDLWRAPILSLVGVLLTWVAVESGSIWPAFVFHLVNNGLALVLANLNFISGQGWIEGLEDVPATVFVLGLALAGLGALLVRRSRIRSVPGSADNPPAPCG